MGNVLSRADSGQQPDRDAGQHVIRFGNGTSAVYASLVALRCQGRKVVVPANICPSVIAAIYASGNLPCFVDLEKERFGLDPAALERVIDDAGAVIAVHLFGTPCRIDELSALCRTRRVPLVEDCAQAEGAVYRDEPVGSYGDISVYSYGAGKIISVDGGGGAASTRAAQLAEALRRVHDSLPRTHGELALEDVGQLYKHLYNRYYPDRLHPVRRAFALFLRDIGPALLCRHDPARDADIGRGKAELEANVRERLRKCAAYRRQLAGIRGIEIPEPLAGSAPWRYNLFLGHDARQRVLRALLAEGFKVSSWYPEITRFLDPDSYTATGLGASTDLGDTVLNLWVDSATTEADIERVCRRVVELVR